MIPFDYDTGSRFQLTTMWVLLSREAVMLSGGAGTEWFEMEMCDLSKVLPTLCEQLLKTMHAFSQPTTGAF